MATKLQRFLVLTIFLNGLGICLNLKNSYIAAVVDYVHLPGDSAKELLNVNVKEYQNLMHYASRQLADIVIFPEYGLVDIETMFLVSAQNKTDLEKYSTFVPDPLLNITPCDDKKTEIFSMQLVNISCAARLHSIYTVFNLPEKAHNNETGNLEFYNTNVVLDREGTVIAKYRKIHTSEESFFGRGNELVTFETDFGVTFGIITCFDILFQNPALEVLLEPNVTDIIFPTAWYSQTPFLQALSVQHGYAKTNGINLLTANLQEPVYQDGGSGVFLADGTIAAAYITAAKETKVIVQEVPIIENRTPASMCLYTKHNTTKKEKQQANEDAELHDIDNFPISRENISDYVFEPISDQLTTIKEVCSKDKKICCTFNITIDELSTLEPDYTYKMAAFNGLSQFGSNIYGGIRVCALLACSNDSDNSCGYKNNSTLVSYVFKNIDIVTIMDISNETYIQPSTLKNDLIPISDYIYCEMEINNGTQMKISMNTTAPQDSLVTFGLYGRVYSSDKVVSKPGPKPDIPLNFTLIFMIVSSSVIIMICTAGILYKFCVKKE